MKKGWYILNYHDISNEENQFLKAIGGTYPPDIFYNQVKLFSEHARLLPVQEAFDLYKRGAINEPVVSFWFDDGLRGVSEHALPILNAFKTTAATSINSDFFLKQDIFWGCKLSYIKNNDGLRFFRTKLKKHGYKISINESLKSYIKDHFSLELHELINELYEEMTSPLIREDAKRLYDGVDGNKKLLDSGWLLTNHSQSHYPVTNDGLIHLLESQYKTCDQHIKDSFGIDTAYWVLPFDRPQKSPKLIPTFNAITKEKTLVFVGDKVNNNPDNEVLYRVSVPYFEGKELLKYISKKPFAF